VKFTPQKFRNKEKFPITTATLQVETLYVQDRRAAFVNKYK